MRKPRAYPFLFLVLLYFFSLLTASSRTQNNRSTILIPQPASLDTVEVVL
jgi:hypothetical protein